MFKVIILLAFIGLVCSAPTLPEQDGRIEAEPHSQVDNVVDESSPVLIDDHGKELLNDAESSYISLRTYPFVSSDSYYPVYYPGPTVYHAQPQLHHYGYFW